MSQPVSCDTLPKQLSMAGNLAAHFFIILFTVFIYLFNIYLFIYLFMFWKKRPTVHVLSLKP